MIRFVFSLANQSMALKPAAAALPGSLLTNANYQVPLHTYCFLQIPGDVYIH